MSSLNTNSTVAQWVAENPQTAAIFEELQIDYCCGGGISLSEACEQLQVDVNEVLSRLREAIDDPGQTSTENWVTAPLRELCDHIEATHHAYLRKELPRLTGCIEKVVNAHGANHPYLEQLQHVVGSLRAELELHMMKEERILFPAIRQMEQASTQTQFPFGSVANPIHMMEDEHEHAGTALARIRELTGGYQLPQDACPTFSVMMDSLQCLEGDLHRHIHKENFVLFPRAQQLESSMASSLG